MVVPFTIKKAPTHSSQAERFEVYIHLAAHAKQVEFSVAIGSNSDFSSGDALPLTFQHNN